MRHHLIPPRLVPLVLGTLLVTSCTGAGELSVEDARSRMSPMFAGVGAVYLDITNTTSEDDRLVGAGVEEEVAASVEIHETFDADEMTHDAPDHDAETDDAGTDGEMHDGEMHGEAMAGEAPPGPEGFAMMGMREIEDLAIPAGETVELVPGGHHIMLIDLAGDLEVGREFELVLEFEKAGTRTVTVAVRDEV